MVHEVPDLLLDSLAFGHVLDRSLQARVAVLADAGAPPKEQDAAVCAADRPDLELELELRLLATLDLAA